MAPTLAPKQTLLLLRHVPIRRFDLVVFEDPQVRGTYDIKRVIGLPGETVFLKDEKLYNNLNSNSARLDSLLTHFQSEPRIPVNLRVSLGDPEGKERARLMKASRKAEKEGK